MKAHCTPYDLYTLRERAAFGTLGCSDRYDAITPTHMHSHTASRGGFHAHDYYYCNICSTIAPFRARGDEGGGRTDENGREEHDTRKFTRIHQKRHLYHTLARSKLCTYTLVIPRTCEHTRHHPQIRVNDHAADNNTLCFSNDDQFFFYKVQHTNKRR